MAFCIRCGAQLGEGIKFCGNCGAKINNAPPYQIVPQTYTPPPAPPQYTTEPPRRYMPPPIHPNIPQYIIEAPRAAPSETTIHHTVDKINTASSGFGKAFGETTGNAVGCLTVAVVIVVVIVVILAIIAVAAF